MEHRSSMKDWLILFIILMVLILLQIIGMTIPFEWKVVAFCVIAVAVASMIIGYYVYKE